MKIPLVSIIVPVYKAEKWLHRCVDSILAQTMEDFELLLIDDGSPDSSGEICDEYAAKDSRVRVFHKENGGVSLARVKGFSESLGKWIMFVDADDLLTENALSCLIDSCCGVDIVSGGMKIIREKINGIEVEEDFPKHIQEVGDYDGSFYAKQILNGSRLCSIWRQLIRREIFSIDDLLIPKEIKIAEDFLINIKISTKIRKYRGIPDVVYKYRYYSSNTSRTFCVTAKYIDVYFDELDAIFASNKMNLQEDVFHYKLSWLSNYLYIRDIEDCKVVEDLKREKKNFRLTFRERLILFSIQLKNESIKRLLWWCYDRIVYVVHFLLIKYGEK